MFTVKKRLKRCLQMERHGVIIDLDTWAYMYRLRNLAGGNEKLEFIIQRERDTDY